MLLTGTFERSLDEKLRISLPKSLREAYGGEGAIRLFIAPGTDGSLALYSEDAFAKLGDRLASVSPNAQDVRNFSRLFFARAQPVDVDKSGRLRIPAELAAFAHIEKTAVLVGVRDHVEIWEKSRWDAYLAETEPRYDQFAERAFDPSVGQRPAG